MSFLRLAHVFYSKYPAIRTSEQGLLNYDLSYVLSLIVRSKRQAHNCVNLDFNVLDAHCKVLDNVHFVSRYSGDIKKGLYLKK